MDKTINQNLIVKGSLTADSVITQKKNEPIGSIIMGTGNNFATQAAVQAIYNGTWEQIKDVFLLAAGDTYIAGSTGGEATHTLTVDEMPNHQHGLVTDMEAYEGVSQTGNYFKMKGNEVVNGYTTETGVCNNGWKGMSGVGGNQSHNNMPPYLTVYMWRRIA